MTAYFGCFRCLFSDFEFSCRFSVFCVCYSSCVVGCRGYFGSVRLRAKITNFQTILRALCVCHQRIFLFTILLLYCILLCAYHSTKRSLIVHQQTQCWHMAERSKEQTKHTLLPFNVQLFNNAIPLSNNYSIAISLRLLKHVWNSYHLKK